MNRFSERSLVITEGAMNRLDDPIVAATASEVAAEGEGSDAFWLARGGTGVFYSCQQRGSDQPQGGGGAISIEESSFHVEDFRFKNLHFPNQESSFKCITRQGDGGRVWVW